MPPRTRIMAVFSMPSLMAMPSAAFYPMPPALRPLPYPRSAPTLIGPPPQVFYTLPPPPVPAPLAALAQHGSFGLGPLKDRSQECANKLRGVDWQDAPYHGGG